MGEDLDELIEKELDVLILVCVEVSVGVSDNYKINFCFRSLNPCLCGS